MRVWCMQQSGNKDFNKKLISLVLPIAFQQFMLNLVSASDALMLGVVGQDQLSAVSLAGQIQFVLSLFLAAMAIGTNIFAAQYWGKKDIPSVEKVFAIALRVTVPVSALFTLCTALFPSPIMRLFTADTALISAGANYLRLASPSYLFCGIAQVYLCVMKNIGHAKMSTVISSVCVVFDALMNAALIFGLLGLPQMRIAGAALSTTIARFAEMGWCILFLPKAKTVNLRPHFIWQPDKRLHKDFWKYTSPVLGNELVWGIGFTMYTVIMGHLGTDAVAANSIASIAKNLVVCFCIGLGSGGGILVGNELGAGRLAEAKGYGDKLCRTAIVSGLVSGGALLCVTPLAVKLTSLSVTADQYLWDMLIMSSVYMVGKSVNVMTIAGIFCAGGDSKFGFLCDTIVMWCITVPLGLVSAFIWKLPVIVVYCIVNADELLKLPAVFRHYKKYLWVRDLTVKENAL